MKKLLSILICVFLGVTNVWAVDATLNVTIKAAYRSTPIATDGEIVSQVCTSEVVDGELQQNCATSKSGITYVVSMDKPGDSGAWDDKENEYRTETKKINGSINLSSNYLGDKDKYVFSHWEVSDDVNNLNVTFQASNSASQCNYIIEVQQQVLFNINSNKKGLTGLRGYSYTVSSKGTVAANITFTAVWVQPQVTGVDADYTLEKITDPSETRTQNIKFTLKDAIAKNNFKCIPEGDGFSLNGTSWSAQYATSYTATALYTPAGIHGTHIGSITLMSNHPSSGATSLKSTLKVEEDYTPSFSLPANYDVSTQDRPTYVGAYTQLTETDIVPTNLNYAARTMLMDGAELKNGCVWNVNLRENTSGFFSLEESGETQVVRFTPTGTVDATTPYTATLDITCTYYDAIGRDIVVTKSIVLSAYAKNDDNARLEIESGSTYDMHFDVIYGTPQKKSASYVAINLSEEPTEVWTSSTNQITYVNSGSLITVSVSNTIALGEHTAKLSYTSGEKNIELNVSADVQLATPVLSAYGGLSQVTLVWTPVYGADEYVIKSGGMIIAEIPAPADSYVIENMTNGTSVTYTVTAVYLDDQQYNKISNEATATPNLPSTITADDVPFLGLYTGTDKYTKGDAKFGKYPYREKRKVDLSAAFKNGVAAFDQLFVFGLTTGDASGVIQIPTRDANSNALTPCYIFTKSGNNYLFSKKIDNVNVATKPAEFNIKANGQKIYMTGYAPYASCGSTWDENGVFFFSGSGTNLDLYLDNLELYARPKAITGTSVPTYIFDIYDLGDLGKFGNNLDLKIEGVSTEDVKVDMYTQGSGSALCFKSTSSAAFTPSIHLNGNNILQSTQGMFVTVDVNVEIDLWIKKFSVDYGPVTASQHSSPIQIIHDKETINNSTILTIDDSWGGSTRTNGALDLAAGTDTRPAPTIDLGNEKTTLQINGGQLSFSNSYNNSDDYVVSYAISYRMHSGMSGRAKMYGIGSDQPGGNVAFNDGTISCKPLPISQLNPDLYHNTTSMKCPWNTKIDGGTFNCDVLACATTTSKGSSPKNSRGDALCIIEIPIESANANGTAVLFNDWMNYAANNGANTTNLDYYGIESLTPETIIGEDDTEIQVVNLMLPSNNVCFVDMQLTHWVMCFPTLSVSGVEIGGPVEVPSSITAGDEGLTKIEKTSKLLYGEIDQLFMPDVIGDYQAPGGIMVELPNGYEDAYVKNTNSYVIYDKVYMLLPVMANQWKMFVPPFDVANVYVIESYPEKKLLEDFDTSTEDGIYDARYQQAWRMLDLFYQWVWNVDQLKNTSDFWSNHKSYAPIGKYESMGSFVQAWMDMYIQRDDKGKVTNDDYKPVIEQLYHYTSATDADYPEGKFWWDANFYLYEADGDIWGTKEEGGLKALWKEVPKVSQPRAVGANANQHEVIMHKGGKYVLNFPSTIVNSKEHDFWTNWDYWTGKYILLEGYPEKDIDSDGNMEPDDRGQVLAGSNTDWNGNSVKDLLLAEYDISESATLRGNYTFSNVDISSLDNAYVLNTYQVGRGVNSEKLYPKLSHNIYVLASGGEENITNLTPSQGFILSNVLAPQGKHVRAINIENGSVVYGDDNSHQDSITGTPTIAGGHKMLVYTIDGGVGIVPVIAQQVSIYNAAGQLITSRYLTEEVQMSLPTGIYLICGEKEKAKAVVR